jgi:hypothetical protein
MKDFLKDELNIYQKFSIAVSNVFRRIRYGIAPCKEGCCEELQGIRFELLQWQKLKDDYSFGNSLTAGLDRTVVLSPGTTTTLSAVYISLKTPTVIQWTQLSGPAVTITSPNSLITTVENITTTGEYIFEISVTDPSGSILTDTVKVTSVTLEVEINWGFTSTNPLTAIQAGTFTGLQFFLNLPISTTVFTDLEFTDAANEQYLILREPIAFNVKANWVNTSFNYGTMPDQVFLAPITVGQYRYYVSRNPVFLGVGTTQITFS